MGKSGYLGLLFSIHFLAHATGRLRWLHAQCPNLVDMSRSTSIYSTQQWTYDVSTIHGGRHSIVKLGRRQIGERPVYFACRSGKKSLRMQNVRSSVIGHGKNLVRGDGGREAVVKGR